MRTGRELHLGMQPVAISGGMCGIFRGWWNWGSHWRTSLPQSWGRAQPVNREIPANIAGAGYDWPWTTVRIPLVARSTSFAARSTDSLYR